MTRYKAIGSIFRNTFSDKLEIGAGLVGVLPRLLKSQIVLKKESGNKPVVVIPA